MVIHDTVVPQTKRTRVWKSCGHLKMGEGGGGRNKAHREKMRKKREKLRKESRSPVLKEMGENQQEKTRTRKRTKDLKRDILMWEDEFF